MKISPIINYNQKYNRDKALDEFLRSYYGCQLHHLASDLLDKGLSPVDIITAIKRAMTICQTGGLEVQAHFMPIYSSRDGAVIRDCKLSELGLKLVLLNARPSARAVAQFQLRVVKLL